MEKSRWILGYGYDESAYSQVVATMGSHSNTRALRYRLVFLALNNSILIFFFSRLIASSPAPSTPIKLKSLTTLKAHDKDINALDVAPNGKLVATGSQDKTAKIFEVGVSFD